MNFTSTCCARHLVSDWRISGSYFGGIAERVLKMGDSRSDNVSNEDHPNIVVYNTGEPIHTRSTSRDTISFVLQFLLL